MAIILHNCQEAVVELLLSCEVLKRPVGNAIQQRKISGGVFFGRRLPALDQLAIMLTNIFQARDRSMCNVQELDEVWGRVKGGLERHVHGWASIRNPAW